jgi:hypothetical protein
MHTLHPLLIMQVEDVHRTGDPVAAFEEAGGSEQGPSTRRSWSIDDHAKKVAPLQEMPIRMCSGCGKKDGEAIALTSTLAAIKKRSTSPALRELLYLYLEDATSELCDKCGRKLRKMAKGECQPGMLCCGCSWGVYGVPAASLPYDALYCCPVADSNVLAPVSSLVNFIRETLRRLALPRTTDVTGCENRIQKADCIWLPTPTVARLACDNYCRRRRCGAFAFSTTTVIIPCGEYLHAGMLLVSPDVFRGALPRRDCHQVDAQPGKCWSQPWRRPGWGGQGSSSGGHRDHARTDPHSWQPAGRRVCSGGVCAGCPRCCTAWCCNKEEARGGRHRFWAKQQSPKAWLAQPPAPP